MKKIFKKNQIIIASLVVMIIVAGYLNFTADQSTAAITGKSDSYSKDELADISEEDMVVDVAVNPEEDMADIENANLENTDSGNTLLENLTNENKEYTNKEDAGTETKLPDDQSAGQSEDTSAETENTGDVSTIGEAVLTSAAAKNFSAAAKLNREQTRAQNQETLMQVINSSDVSEEAKQTAMDSLLALTETAEKELAAETLLEAKGFSNSVVAINSESVDVVICLESIDDIQKAQIEDIVKRKAEVEADRIVITTLNQ